MFQLNLQRKIRNTASKSGYGEIFNSLHFFLINSPESNIAWTYHRQIHSFIFYSTVEKDLNRFKEFLEDQSISVFDSKVNDHKSAFKAISHSLKTIVSTFSIKNIKEIALPEDNNFLVLLKKSKSPNDRLSRSALVKKISYLSKFKEGNGKVLSPLNAKLSRLFKLMDINKEEDLLLF